MNDEKNKWKWILRPGAVIGFGIAFALILFILVPMSMERPRNSEIHIVDFKKWSPDMSVEVCHPDSLYNLLNSEDVSLFLRYDASAPENLPLVVNSVLKDGYERQDTMRIMLKDAYGRLAGKHGRLIVETRIPFAPKVFKKDCRLMEMYPADTVRGVHAVCVMVEGKER